MLFFPENFLKELGIYFHRVLSDPYSDVLCSEECQTKKLLVCRIMFAFFKAIILCLLLF